MGGERAATTRQRLAGKICCLCRASLDPPPPGHYGERQCPACAGARIGHRVLMNFMERAGEWHIGFLEPDCRTVLPRRLCFANEEKIFDAAKRGRADLSAEARFQLQRDLNIGRGGVWLNLTEAQYRQLK